MAPEVVREVPNDCQEVGMMSGHQMVGKTVFPVGKSTSDHRTPSDLFMRLSDEVGGFDLDVAASDENHLCDEYYTMENNGLFNLWEGKVWCNPPYNNIQQWVNKARAEVTVGRASVVWMLVPAHTSTQWFQSAFLAANELRFIIGRLDFSGPHSIHNSTAPFPSVLIRFGGDESKSVHIATRQGEVKYFAVELPPL